MKHLCHKPKEKTNLTSTHSIQDEWNPYDIIIFHNIIALNANIGYFTLEGFVNSFNDASQLNYLEPEYKEKVVQAYWENQNEFPNEDLMYFEGEFSYRDKVLISNYSKNKRMLEQILSDSNASIRKELTKRKDLSPYIVDQLIGDLDADIRLNITALQLLTKEQIKLYIKENDERIIANLLAKYGETFDDEMVDYFVKNGSNEIKEQLSFQPISKINLTDEQIEFLSQPENSNSRTKENLIIYYRLSENIITFLLSLEQMPLMRQIAYYRNDLTKVMIDKIIESNDYSVMLSLLQNSQLCLKSPPLYQYATLQMLFKSDDIEFLKIALGYYARMQDITYLRLPPELMEHLAQVNHKKAGLKFANFLLRVQDIPQYLAEFVILDSITKCKTGSASEKHNWYSILKRNTQYQLIIEKVKNYIII